MRPGNTSPALLLPSHVAIVACLPRKDVLTLNVQVHMSEEAANATKAVVCSKIYLETKAMNADMNLTAFWHSHVHRILLVLRFHHRNRASCVYQSRSKLSPRVKIRPADGAGEFILGCSLHT